ncbi:MAG: HigA family addiction module antidote protein [Nitrospinae bacterium]|nr:HigA family addiction module antidote protein [Nitrospinota bacterium]
MAKIMPPITPGEILKEEFMEPAEITQNALGRAIKVPPGRINEIIRGKRVITADTALRFAAYFGTTPGFWMNLQSHYELEVARDANDRGIASIQPASQRRQGAKSGRKRRVQKARV